MDLDALTDSLPRTFLPAVIRSVFLGRRASWDHCAAEFAPSEARNVRPFHARGKIEGLLRDVATVTPGCVASTVEQSGWSHVELGFGNLTLTAHSVPTPCAMVDPAEYRVELAMNNDPTLFDDLLKPEPKKIYGVLIHSSYRGRSSDSAAKNYGYLPGSIYLAYPITGLTRYAHPVNLFDRYPDVVRALLPQEWSEQAEVRYFFSQARQRAA